MQKTNQLIDKMVRMAEKIAERDRNYIAADEDDPDKEGVVDEQLESILDMEDAFLDRFGDTLRKWVDNGYREGIDRLIRQVKTVEALQFLEDQLADISDESLWSSADGEAICYSLIATPIVGILPAQPVLSKDSIDTFTKSLRRYGFIGKSPSVAVLPLGISLSDANLHWCDRKRFLSKMTRMLHSEKVDFTKDPFVRSELQDDDQNPTLRLRFLVGVLVWALEDAEEARLETTTEAADEWLEEMSKLLETDFEGVQLGLPDQIRVAFREGITQFNLAKLGLLLEGLDNTTHQEYGLAIEMDDETIGVNLMIVDCATHTIVTSMLWDMMPADSAELIDYESDMVISLAEQYGLRIISDVTTDRTRGLH